MFGFITVGLWLNTFGITSLSLGPSAPRFLFVAAGIYTSGQSDFSVWDDVLGLVTIRL